jgi:hypothetical protein
LAAGEAHGDGGALGVVADLCGGDLAEDAKADAGLEWLLAGGAVIGDSQDQVGVGLVGVELDRPGSGWLW